PWTIARARGGLPRAAPLAHLQPCRLCDRAGCGAHHGAVGPGYPSRRPTVVSGDLRTLPVPEGLSGERLDAALARMFGLSRTKAAGRGEWGAVRSHGNPPAKIVRGA